MEKSTIFSKDRFSLLDKIIYYSRKRIIKPFYPHNEIVCDLGCGTSGYFLKELEQDISIGYGFDLEVDTATNNQKIRLQATNLEQSIPLASKIADKVFSMAVIEHLYNGELHINEAFRILKDGGTFVCTTPSPYAKPVLELLASLGLINKSSIADHKHYFNKSDLVALAKKAGFKNVSCRYFQGVFNQLLVAQK